MVDVVANCGTTQFVGPKLFGSEVNSYGGLAVTAAPPPGWVALSVQPATLLISVPTSVTAPAQSTGPLRPPLRRIAESATRTSCVPGDT